MPMQQHPSYGAAAGALGSEAFHLEWRTGDRVLASAQVLRRHWPLMGPFALVSRGPVFDPALSGREARDATRALVRLLAREHRGVMVTPEPGPGGDPLADAGLLRMVTAARVARLSLLPPPETLRAGLHQKWRNMLTRAEAAPPDIRIAPMPDDPNHWLLQKEAAQARARRYARLPPAFALAWARRGDTLLVTAEAGGTPIAGMLFLLHPPWASYHVGWTSAEGRAARAHHLMLWRAISALKDRGIAALELGALDTVKTPDLARFKLGTGARPVTLGATWMRAPGSRPVAALARLGARVRPPAPEPA